MLPGQLAHQTFHRANDPHVEPTDFQKLSPEKQLAWREVERIVKEQALREQDEFLSDEAPTNLTQL